MGSNYDLRIRDATVRCPRRPGPVGVEQCYACPCFQGASALRGTIVCRPESTPLSASSAVHPV